MADYCSLAEALSLLPTMGTLGTSTVPTATQGAAVLASVTAEIDMHLRGRDYTTPPTDAQALASLKTICMNGTAARLAKAKWPAAQGVGGDGGAAEMLREDYLRGLAFIDAGGLALDSDIETAGSSFAHGFGDGTYDYSGNEIGAEEPF